MSGPRVTSGSDSAQDVGTPPEFISAIERRFAPIRYDLAAHAGNAKHSVYLAPTMLEAMWDPKTVPLGVFVRQMMRAGAHLDELTVAVNRILASGDKGKVCVRNHDQNAHAFDAFAQDWAALAQRHSEPDGKPGLGWLNCEWADVDPWAVKSRVEMSRGANLLLLTTGGCPNWFRDNIAGRADVYDLSGRITFLGSKACFAKDLVVSHFHPRASGRRAIWEWKRDKMHCQWLGIT